MSISQKRICQITFQRRQTIPLRKLNLNLWDFSARNLHFCHFWLAYFLKLIGIRWLFFLIIFKSQNGYKDVTLWHCDHWSLSQSRIALVFIRLFNFVHGSSALLTIFWFYKCGIWRGSLLGNEHSNLPIYFGFDAEFLIQSKVIFGRFFLIRSISVNETSISGSQPGQGVSIWM